MECQGPPIADQILVYLEGHPRAQDTLEGIGEWWLLQQRLTTAVPRLRRALDELVGQRLVLTRRGPDGRFYYRLNRRRHRAIRARLRAGGRPGVSEARTGPPTRGGRRGDR